VGDTTVFGPTGPLVGSRYRFEIAPAIGQLAYTRVLADYRQYLMPVRPYSVALRLLHSGRYGPDGDDPRLLSSFLGSRYLVRGHATDGRYCQPDPQRVCGDELLGSRLVVANLELRFPLWGLFSRQLEYGPLPADGFVFADGGLVWSRDRSLSATPDRRAMISSVGAGVRLNAGGLPLELAAVRALDGPARRWSFDIGFRVGF
jgi:outer membrane protein assembly factor BamA